MLWNLFASVTEPEFCLGPETENTREQPDRRRHRRHPATFLARGIGLPGYVVRGYELGLGGFRLRVNEKPPRQTPMELVLECGGAHLKVVAECRWVKPSQDSYIAGFEFRPLNALQHEILSDYLRIFS